MTVRIIEPGWGVTAVAALSEGFCPLHRERLMPAVNCAGVPGGRCGNCRFVWYRYGDWVNFCSGPGMPAGHCRAEATP